MVARHPRRHQPARKARPDPPHPPRHRTALRRLDRPGGDPHADLRRRDDRLPENAAPDEAPPPAPETPGSVRLPRRSGTSGSPGRRTPEGAGDRDPDDASRRDPRREVGELARGGVGLSGPDRGAVRRREGGGGAALRAGLCARERLRAVRGARRQGSRRWGEVSE